MNDMSAKPEIADFVKTVAGLKDAGSPRLNQIVAKIVADLFDTIARFDVSEDEFWHALNYLAESAPEFGLWAAGLGFEHLLDLRMDEKDAQAGIPEGTPRTIEGPLYVAGAPLIESGGRIDDGTDVGETLIMHGQVRDIDGKPLAGAIVDVWHANTKGNYSTFDKSQSAYNMRRRVLFGSARQRHRPPAHIIGSAWQPPGAYPFLRHSPAPPASDDADQYRWRPLSAR
jgi:catechol 1,2-dioxygenase